MTSNQLRRYRVLNAETQKEVAKVAGVTQPTYQRWEAGKVDVPKENLAKLAKHFEVTELQLLGRHPPVTAAFYDDSAPIDLQYYGEIAVHFVSGAEPLVLSISEAAHKQAYRELQSDKRFIVIKDLSNRTVAIRNKAISEFYHSSEAYDWYGPAEEHEGYKLATPIQMPDSRDWAIVEALSHEDDPDEDAFAKEDVERVRKCIMITDEEFDDLVAKGAIKPEDLASEKADRAEETDEIFALAQYVTVRLASGKERKFHSIGWNIFECLEPLENEHYPEIGNDDDGVETIRVPHTGYHQTAFFNPDAVDYISFPTHRVEQGRIESYDDGLIDFDDNDGDGEVIKLPVKAKKKPATRKKKVLKPRKAPAQIKNGR